MPPLYTRTESHSSAACQCAALQAGFRPLAVLEVGLENSALHASGHVCTHISQRFDQQGILS